jgi:hypothetical protein
LFIFSVSSLTHILALISPVRGVERKTEEIYTTNVVGCSEFPTVEAVELAPNQQEPGIS